MADRGDTHYHVPLLNGWFAVSSLLLLIASVWMVLADWNRPWKHYQREFRDVEIKKAEAVLDSPDARKAADEERRLAAELAETRGRVESGRTGLDAAQAELVQLKARQFVATEEEKKAKQEYNWERYLVEEERQHRQDPAYDQARI